MDSSVNKIEYLAFILGVISFFIAYYQWTKTQREKRLHLLKTLKEQLDCLKSWMGVYSGYGYGDELTEDQKFDNANPTKIIYSTAADALIGINSLEHITRVDAIIIKELNELYYDLVRIKELQDIRTKYVFSDIDIANSLEKNLRTFRLTNANKIKPMSEFQLFLESNHEDGENLLLSRLLVIGKTIHCTTIGNKDRGARNHWEKLYSWVNEQLKSTNDRWLFIVAYITVILSSGTFCEMIKIHYYATVFFWLICLIFGLFINLFIGSIDGLTERFGFKRIK